MSTIPPIQDYDDDDPEIDFRRKRFQYWQALKTIRQEYMADMKSLDGQFDAYDFEDYVEANYGIKMNMAEGRITDSYKIMDEKKYIIFLLKYQ